MILFGKKKIKVADLFVGQLFVVPIELGNGVFCTCLYRCEVNGGPTEKTLCSLKRLVIQVQSIIILDHASSFVDGMCTLYFDKRAEVTLYEQ